MFPQLSLGEIALIVVVAVVFIRPDDWPRCLRLVGRLYGQVHAYLLRAHEYSRQTYDQVTQLDREPPPPHAPAPPAGTAPASSAPAASGTEAKPHDGRAAK